MVVRSAGSLTHGGRGGPIAPASVSYPTVYVRAQLVDENGQMLALSNAVFR
jgi:hypothetical protein